MRILLAYDGSANATMAADLVRGIAWPPNSILRVISVIEPNVVGLTAWAGSAAGYSPEIDVQISVYYTGDLAATVSRSVKDLSNCSRSLTSIASRSCARKPFGGGAIAE